jgi:hypothetical protein
MNRKYMLASIDIFQLKILGDNDLDSFYSKTLVDN